MQLYRLTNYTVTTTVGELIKKLQTLDPEAYVFTQGCDCIGNVVDVLIEADGTILIDRDDDIDEYMNGEFILKEQYLNRIEDRR